MLSHLLRGFRKKVSPPIVVNVIDEDYAVDFCLQWNLNFPIDRWWRDKHKVAFNSPEHREVSFWDMRIEFEEYILFRRREKANEYQPDVGDWLKIEFLVDNDEGLSEEERRAKYKREFESIDLDQYK